ncbi:MAG: hypothetical protein ASUL_03214 [Candidatus Aramenus sulfurataquae]|jgi:hypothetical protein|uniref:Uncharacterized protein n=2 Tax=Candidatus Aramenus sulfurataquae TaxID=1326980 RepID=W7KJE3_9CREN|nr:MAG: hypothetical protein ASUL_03214 [Candidatus Aramenus sulfurataquae]MCL7343686.1 hypothetical protein [Candidatus Aramenus sulfurataquae]
MKLKLPPRIKVLEALGAIADGRIRKADDHYEVVSSEGDRTYIVKVNGNKVSSTDNGTTYRGYVGYPIIAVLMLEGRLPFNEKVSKSLKGIDWRRLNEQYKSYAKVEELVKKIAEERGVKKEEIDTTVEVVLNELKRIPLEKAP